MNIMVGPDGGRDEMREARCAPCGGDVAAHQNSAAGELFTCWAANSCAAPELSQPGQRPATPRKEAAAPVLSGARPQASFTGARTADWECGRGGNAPLGRGAAAALT